MTTYRASHADIGPAVNDWDVLISEQFTTTLRGCYRLLPAEPAGAITAS
ncbi:MAG TPA: hypothetical protein VKG83_17170 [Mycobacterium sp.]|nr:hypothetical protein [Mycobacterium sp.]